jgi:hypothetical protein
MAPAWSDRVTGHAMLLRVLHFRRTHRSPRPTMQIHRPLRDAIGKIAFYVQSLRLWALELLAWWAETCGARSARIDFQRGLRRLRRATRLVFLIAVVARLNIPVHARTEAPRPFGSPQGFRYRCRRIRFVRMITRRIRLKTLADIRAALEAFDALVACALARVPKRIIDGALVMRGLRRATCAFACIRLSPEAADTS